MKKMILILGPISGLFSCNKSQTSTNNGNISGGQRSSSSQIATLSLYSPSSKNLTKYAFGYDANGTLNTLIYSSNDTTGGIAALDSGSYYFTIDPSTQLTTSYTLTWSNANSGSASETHRLFFDDQKRLIKDTLVAGQAQAGHNTTFYFSYPEGGIVSNRYAINAYNGLNKTYGWGMTGIDSISLVNSNIGSQYEYAQIGTSWVMGYAYVVKNYSSYLNPLHGLDQSSGLGTLLRNYNSLDCISKNLPLDGMVNWTTDASGRVTGGLATDGGITAYTYK